MKVVVLGAGPAGCAAAHFLRQKGITDITLVDSGDIGGCARTRVYEGIPYEFGPQIMFTDKDYLKGIFEQWLTQHTPPSEDGEYHYVVSVDGTLEDPHDFPLTTANVLKLENREDVIWQLYNTSLSEPDYSNFENYAISRVGRSMYETYIKNYNRKAWQMDPKDMDTDWVHFRPLSLKQENSRFGGQWQGHPGNYNPMWHGMIEGISVTKGLAAVNSEGNWTVDGDPVEADLVVTTLSLSEDLDFVNTFMAFAVVESEDFVMPACFTTFPNTNTFVRALEYKQQYFVESPYSLLSFDCPWTGSCDIDAFMEDVVSFCRSVLKKDPVETWYDNRENIYPLSTRANANLFDSCIDNLKHSNVVPIGRAGMHAYCSKDTVIRMGLEVAQYLDELRDPEQKIKRLWSMREDLH